MAGGRTGDVNVPLIFTVGLITTILVAVIVIGVQAWYSYEYRRELEQKVLNQPNWELQQLEAEQLANLQGGRKVDAEGNRVTVSLDRAMDLVVERYQQ